MPDGLVFSGDDTQLLNALRERFDAHSDGSAVEMLVTSGVPDRTATHVVISGPLTDEVDAWDRDVPPQTLAGALWLPAGQDGFEAVCAWWLLRRQTPTTPLSDLLDDNDRALRWSVVGARAVQLPGAAPAEVEDAEIRAWLDDQPQVAALGSAIDRLGGDSADAVLTSADRYREALRKLDELAPLPPGSDLREFDAAVAEHLRQVQRSGFARWRGGRARAESQDAVVSAAKSAAADRLRTLIDARSEQVRHERRQVADDAAVGQIVDALADAVSALELPCAVDFDQVPRSWSAGAPEPRRYALVAEDLVDSISVIPGAVVRGSEDIPAGTALCMIIQSGFSLPAIRA